MSKKAKEKKRNRRRPNSARSQVDGKSGLLGAIDGPAEKPHQMIALALACLVAGLLILINLDRTIHTDEAAKLGRGTSLHGWPAVYLQRRYDSLPSFLTASRRNDWPFPRVKNEIRTMNYSNLIINLLCGLLITALSYLVLRVVVYRYEEWKKSWATE